MNKFSKIYESNSQVDLGVKEVSTELIYLTENQHQVGSLIVMYNGSEASVYSVAVLDKHRGKGYGKRLMEKAITRCKEKNCKLLRLNTELDNTVANKMYQSMGFRLNGIIDDFNNYSLDL